MAGVASSNSAGPPPADPRATQLSPRLLRVIVASIALLLIESSAYAVILVSPRVFGEPIRRTSAIYAEKREWMHRIAADSAGRVQIDSLLGWRFRSGFRGAGDTINAQGLRSSREYSTRPAPSVLRVAAFGESFVYGAEVGNDSAWTTLVERLDPRIEVLNYAVGGYGDDQAYLRFLVDGRALSPDVALLGFSTDDLRRVTNVYFPYISSLEVPLFKPRFVWRDSGTLALLPTPAPTVPAYLQFADNPALLRRVARDDQWYEPLIYGNPFYDFSASVRVASYLWSRVSRRYFDPERIWDGRELRPGSSAFRLQSEVFVRFVQAVDSVGIRPLILLLPDKESVERARSGGRTLYWTLAANIAQRQIPCVDAIAAFRVRPAGESADQWFAPGGHLSAAGNEIVARWLTSVVPRYASASSRPDTPGVATGDRCGSGVQ